MTEEQANRITALATDAENKRLKYQNMGMMNAAGLSHEERVRQSAAYHLAHAEYLEAIGLLDSAKRSVNVAPAA